MHVVGGIYSGTTLDDEHTPWGTVKELLPPTVALRVTLLGLKMAKISLKKDFSYYFSIPSILPTV